MPATAADLVRVADYFKTPSPAVHFHLPLKRVRRAIVLENDFVPFNAGRLRVQANFDLVGGVLLPVCWTWSARICPRAPFNCAVAISNNFFGWGLMLRLADPEGVHLAAK